MSWLNETSPLVRALANRRANPNQGSFGGLGAGILERIIAERGGVKPMPTGGTPAPVVPVKTPLPTVPRLGEGMAPISNQYGTVNWDAGLRMPLMQTSDPYRLMIEAGISPWTDGSQGRGPFG